METTTLIRYDTTPPHELEDFEDLMLSLQFKYNTIHLALAGIEPDDILASITRAMKICRLNGIDTTHHFRSLYIFDDDRANTYCDWRMTRQGFTLAVLNASNPNEAIARCQWELVNKLVSA